MNRHEHDESAGNISTLTRLVLVAAAVVGLAACGNNEEPTYEADATDVSGGELIVEDATEAPVEVELPDTAMTNVPAEPAAPPPAE